MQQFETRRLSLNGVTLNIVDQGRGEPVLLVHGFPDDHEVWRQQIPALLQAGYRVIAPDMRGCGESEAPAGVAPYKLDRLVGDLLALLDALGLPKVRLVGHDWGAVIAWTLAIRHPQRVHNYVALSVGHPSAYARAPLQQKIMGWYILMFQLRGFAEWLMTRRDWRWTRGFTGQHAELKHWLRKLARPGRLTAAVSWYRANLALILPFAQAKPALPVLGLWSDGDAYLCEAQMRESERWVTGPWRYVRLNGASHWLQLDQPERVNRLILDEFQRHPLHA
ncbi:alpha/beta fold hydrolase [Paucibacter sediminis]|uniref:Alpha/beta fold hydrolase n=1 Tax=Paucibacter sediminis TaxID=3019553 RepID=A0AA95ND76_9BURK|nr:alpha/beta fold hydrolase [Paucibacter sp. S2-9]WIT11563.1 alpha/beta fold hydrolase [Paucibacter sp. S2-9]